MVANDLHSRLAAVGIALTAVVLLSAGSTGPIKQLKIAPEAEIVPLFDGAADGRFHVRLSVQDAYGANVFITNTTSEPLNVALPKAAVGVHVLPQFNQGILGPNAGVPGQPGIGPIGFFNSQGQNPTGALNAVGNLAQSVGGTLGPFGILNNGAGNGNPFSGFPSVPPEWAGKPGLDEHLGFAAVPAKKTIQLQMRTVCLNYGRPEPNPGLPYVLTSVEQYSRDPALRQLLESYSPRMDQKVMQAAAWRVASGLSWEQMSKLPDPRLRGTSARLFNARQVQAAEQLLAALEQPVDGKPTPQDSVRAGVASAGRTR